MRYVRSPGGFSLIELLIVVAIVSILATISVASYRSYMLRANRTEGTGALLRVRLAQENFYNNNGRFATNAQLTMAIPNGLGMSATTAGGKYQLRIINADPTLDFTVTAVPIGSQVGDKDCQTVSVNQAGTRTATNLSGADSSAACWH